MRLVPHTHSLTTLRRLVRAVGTVDIMVTDKVFGDAVSVLTHELVLVAGVVVH